MTEAYDPHQDWARDDQTRAGTVVADNDAALVAAIDAAGLGPVSAAEVREVDGVPVMFVELDVASRCKARALARWLDRIDVVDMVAGKLRAGDTVLRLNIRGRSSAGPVVVVAPFSERTEARQAELIRAEIERQQPRHLVAALAGLAAHRRSGGAR